MVELREITSDNLEDVLNLQIFEYQDKFVSSTAQALAQAYVYHETAFPFAIYADDTLVGFIMFGYYTSRSQYTLWKFLIDRQYQKKGYGKEALSELCPHDQDGLERVSFSFQMSAGLDNKAKLQGRLIFKQV